MKLFEPGRIGNLSIKNRIVMAAMGIGGLIEPDGRLSQRAIDYYVARARGGAGFIITCTVHSRRLEQLAYAPLVGDMAADGKIYASRLSELADAVHDYGAKVAVQIMPGWGRIAGAELRRKGKAVAPSALPCFWDPNVITRELTTQEVEDLIADFELIAETVSAAGIDAAEINCHAGYLADQFMTPLWNKRTDRYGGDLNGRLRFLLEIIERVKKGAGAGFPVIVKYALTHHLDGGRGIEEGLEIARRLEAAGVSALDIDAGCYETWYWTKPTTYSPPGSLVEMAEMAKQAVSIPVIAVGKLGYPDVAERVLREGKADFIALARPLLADPEWPNKVKEGMEEDIRPCIGDHEGCSGRIAVGRYIGCVVNPATGMEREFDIKPAEKKKSVLVVGGGPGGMEAARVAALRGHRVVLWERADVLGGNLLPASVPDFKQDYRSLIRHLSLQVEKAGVDVKLSTEAAPQAVRKANPDVVIVATGSKSLIPDIPGIEKDNVATAVDVFLGKKEAGETVVVIGGGLVGCEAALYLARKGKRLTVVARHGVARGMFAANRLHLLKLLADADVRIFADTGILEIADVGVVVSGKRGERSTLAADTVMLAVGSTPDDELLKGLQGMAAEVYAVGDCVKPRKVEDAVHGGFRIARLI